MKQYRLDNTKARLLMRLARLHHDPIGMSLLTRSLDVLLSFGQIHEELYPFLLEENTLTHFAQPGYGIVRKDAENLTICVGFDVIEIVIFEEE